MPAWFVAVVALRRGESPEYLLLGRRKGGAQRESDPECIDDELLERLRAIVNQVESIWEDASIEGEMNGGSRRAPAASR